MKVRQLIGSLRSEQGASLVEVGLVLPMLLFIVLATVDFARGFYYANEVAGGAHAGAVYGSQNLSDTTGISNAVKYDAPDVSDISVSSSWGCECSDGTSASVSCASAPSCSGSSIVNYVRVTATASYTTLLPWTGIPSTLTLSSISEMRN
jgi:Flp pilus assembly protein TadG